MKQLIDDLARAYEHADRDIRSRSGGRRWNPLHARDGHHDRLAAILDASSTPSSSCRRRRSVAVEYHRDHPYVYHLDGRTTAQPPPADPATDVRRNPTARTHLMP
jgi:hypothetical protein